MEPGRTSPEPEGGRAQSTLSAFLVEIARQPDEAPDAKPPGPGEKVGRFEVVREIGRGGFGLVAEILLEAKALAARLGGATPTVHP